MANLLCKRNLPLNDEHNFFFAKNNFNSFELTGYVDNINYTKNEA